MIHGLSKLLPKNYCIYLTYRYRLLKIIKYWFLLTIRKHFEKMAPHAQFTS